jgi:hypothetical protein
MTPAQVDRVCDLVREMLTADPCSGARSERLDATSRCFLRMTRGTHSHFHDGRHVSTVDNDSFTLVVDVDGGTHHTNTFTRDEREDRQHGRDSSGSSNG